MSAQKPKEKLGNRERIGRVTVYDHHGSWYTYHRESGVPVRHRVGTTRAQAECVASLINAKFAAAAAGLAIDDAVGAVIPSLSPRKMAVAAAELPCIPVAELRDRFLRHGASAEHVTVESVLNATAPGSEPGQRRRPGSDHRGRRGAGVRPRIVDEHAGTPARHG